MYSVTKVPSDESFGNQPASDSKQINVLLQPISVHLCMLHRSVHDLVISDRLLVIVNIPGRVLVRLYCGPYTLLWFVSQQVF